MKEKSLEYDIPELREYCSLWLQDHMNETDKAALQYYPNGTKSSNPQSGYFAQGLQSMFFAGLDKDMYTESLKSSLAHFSPATKTFDSSSCMGIYHSAFAVRSLGMGLGRDQLAFSEPEKDNSEMIFTIVQMAIILLSLGLLAVGLLTKRIAFH